MLDCSKLADAVILLIDASTGIEIETLEFAELCRTHGSPRVFGMLTHIDVLETKSAQNKSKKDIKKKFKSEIGEVIF